jgi:group I intron endonuclease
MKTRKALKAAYKEMKFQMGAFQIRNISNGRIFIGTSNNLEAIWNRHRFQLNMGSHRNAMLQKDWKALGEENFAFEVLEKLDHEEGITDYNKELEVLEEMFLEELQPYGDGGYNKKKKA